MTAFTKRKRNMLKCRHALTTAGQLLILALIVTMANSVRGEAAPSVNPYEIVLNGSMPPGTEGLNLSFPVPAGKTLVIEYVSGTCFVPSGQACVLSVLTEVNGATIGTPFNLETSGVGAFGGGVELELELTRFGGHL